MGKGRCGDVAVKTGGKPNIDWLSYKKEMESSMALLFFCGFPLKQAQNTPIVAHTDTHISDTNITPLSHNEPNEPQINLKAKEPPPRVAGVPQKRQTQFLLLKKEGLSLLVTCFIHSNHKAPNTGRDFQFTCARRAEAVVGVGRRLAEATEVQKPQRGAAGRRRQGLRGRSWARELRQPKKGTYPPTTRRQEAGQRAKNDLSPFEKASFWVGLKLMGAFLRSGSVRRNMAIRAEQTIHT